MEDKEFYVTPTSKFNCQSFPIIENEKILVNDEILQQLGITKCFDLEDMCVVDYDNSEDLKRQTAQERIAELKQLLKDYDYIGTKIATGRGTREEYAKQIAQMTVWADEINELEASL